MMFRILDLDNTICNDSHRINKIDWQHKDPMRRYHRYHLLSAFDEPGNEDLFRECEHGLIILTARPAHYAELTYEWLKRNGVNYKFILMRNNDDHTSSVQLKHKQMTWLLGMYDIHPCELADAYDDREDVVAMYRNDFSLNAHRRFIHETSSYIAPGDANGNNR